VRARRLPSGNRQVPLVPASGLLAIGVAALVPLTDCALAHRPAQRPPDLSEVVPLRARRVYREMGLMVDTSQSPFVASARFLAGATPDSTLLVFAMSLANRSLTSVATTLLS
jgi:hypothetical protein